MESILKAGCRGAMGALLIAAAASGAMPAAQQNALVQKYCAVCHDDTHRNGGLSLERFDAARPDPGVAAMLVSKLTSGLTPEEVETAQHDSAAAARVVKMTRTGAMGAAGRGVPDRATQDALLSALAAEAAGATEWNVNRTEDPATKAAVLTADILRETASPAHEGITDMYRLTLTCHTGTHEAEMRLAWANAVPEQGRVMSVAVDERATKPALPLPQKALTVSNLFPGETVVFPFDGLNPNARHELSMCFAGTNRH